MQTKPVTIHIGLIEDDVWIAQWQETNGQPWRTIAKRKTKDGISSAITTWLDRYLDKIDADALVATEEWYDI